MQSQKPRAKSLESGETSSKQKPKEEGENWTTLEPRTKQTKAVVGDRREKYYSQNVGKQSETCASQFPLPSWRNLTASPNRGILQNDYILNLSRDQSPSLRKQVRGLPVRDCGGSKTSKRVSCSRKHLLRHFCVFHVFCLSPKPSARPLHSVLQFGIHPHCFGCCGCAMRE